MSLLLAGEVGVASIALLLAVMGVMLGVVRRSEEFAWAGLICLGTAAYAALQFFYYQSVDASQSVELQKLEYVALAVFTTSLFEYGAVRRGHTRVWPRRAARALTLVAIALASTTDMMVARTVVWRPVGPPGHLVPEPGAAVPFGVMFLLYCLALGISGARDVLRSEQPSRLLVVGLGVWIVAGTHDLLRTLDVVTDRIYLLEYGFLAFAVALVAQHAFEYAALLAESERARDDLQQQKHRVEELSHNVVMRVEEGIVFVDGAGVVQLWNPTMERISGRAAEDSLGRSYKDLLTVAADGERIQETIDRVLATLGPESLQLELRSGVATSMAIVPASSDPESRSFITVVRDTTRQRALTERMMEMDRMIAAGTLAAGIGHEINNPLSYVLTNLELARERLGRSGTGPNELGQLVDEATEGAKRIRDVVGQLRDMVRPEEHAPPKAVPLGRVLDWAVKMAGAEIRSRAIVERDYDAGAVTRGVESQLGQVFLNLVLNAAQAIEPGAAAKNRIRLSAKRAGDVVRVEVADTGSGIPAGQLERIFEPFFTTKATGAGTGLGLAISRRLVNEHGGRIEVESEPGKGTCFVVELPAADASASLPAPPAVARTTARLRFLLVDDDVLVARALARSLRCAHDVVVCESGIEALAQLAADRHFDVVLSDIMMGDVNGIELHDRVEREYPELAGRVVLMTGGLLTAEAQEFARQHPDRVLHKPLEREAIARLVARFGSLPRSTQACA